MFSPGKKIAAEKQTESLYVFSQTPCHNPCFSSALLWPSSFPAPASMSTLLHNR
jgi:hypothetical protein